LVGIPMEGVNQSSPQGTVAKTIGTGSPMSLNATSNSGDLVIDGITSSQSAGGMTITPDASQTSVFEYDVITTNANRSFGRHDYDVMDRHDDRDLVSHRRCGEAVKRIGADSHKTQAGAMKKMFLVFLFANSQQSNQPKPHKQPRRRLRDLLNIGRRRHTVITPTRSDRIGVVESHPLARPRGVIERSGKSARSHDAVKTAERTGRILVESHEINRAIISTVNRVGAVSNQQVRPVGGLKPASRRPIDLVEVNERGMSGSSRSQ
jgi:hypothetical protein